MPTHDPKPIITTNNPCGPHAGISILGDGSANFMPVKLYELCPVFPHLEHPSIRLQVSRTGHYPHPSHVSRLYLSHLRQGGPGTASVVAPSVTCLMWMHRIKTHFPCGYDFCSQFRALLMPYTDSLVLYSKC